MSKNMTRKGLAFGAGLSLIVSGFAAIPAQATGLDNGFVSLIPADGDEYAILAGADFKLESSIAASVAGATAQYLKFKIDDPQAKSSVVMDANTSFYSASVTASTVDKTATGIVSINLGSAHRFKIGDEVSVENLGLGTETTTTGTTTETVTTDGVAGTAESVALTIGGTPVATNTIQLGNLGASFTYTVTADDVSGTAAADDNILIARSVASAVNALSGSEYTATSSGAVVTLTAKAVGSKTDLTATAGGVGVTATPVVTGGTNPVAEVSTLAVGGTFAEGDRIVVSKVATSDVIYTVTAANVVAASPNESIAASLKAAIDAAGGLLYSTVRATSTITLTALSAGNIAGGDAVAATQTGEQVGLNDDRVTLTSVVGNVISFSGEVTEYPITQLTNDSVVVTLLPSTPSLGSYILDTKSNTVAAKTITLSSTNENLTQTVNVTAWLDSNDNGKIDTTEYRSPMRTVNFLASTAVTPTTVFRPVTAGTSTSVVADVTFSPTINGAQLSSALNLGSTAASLVADFTRPGSTATIASASTSYSDTTKRWTVTSVGMDNAGWNITQPAASITLSSISITSNIVTAKTGTVAHGLQVGDVVNVNATLDRADNSAAKVTSVANTTTFTYAVTTANQGANVVEAADTGTIATTGVSTKLLRNFATTGDYSVQIKLYRYGTSAGLANTGSLVTLSVGSTVASAVALEGVPSATMNTAGQVKAGTTSTEVVVSVTDELGDPVRAGVPVSVTAQKAVGVTGTVTANGVTVGAASAASIVGSTDANGEFKITLTNSGAIAGNTVTMTASAQGVSATNLVVTWQDAVYSILDLNDVNSSSPSRNRAVAAGATHTFDLLVHDQWKAPFTGTDLRLKVAVTGRTVSTNVYSLTAGRASVPVADGALTTGSSTVTVTLEKLTGSTWADLADASGNNWDGTGSGDLAQVTLSYGASATFTLNANASNVPNSAATADLTADVTLLATASLDQRISNAVAPAYTAASKATVAGGVYRSNGVLNAGATVTVSGAGLLFKSGNVWSMDSITIVSNDGTFTADVYSRTSGAKTVTFTSGSATTTQTVTFNAVAGAKGYTVTLNAPESVQRGSTYRVDGQILDVNGNGIALTTAGTGTNPTLSVTYLGLGLVSGGLPTTTDKDGKFYFYVLVGTNDVGTATITASYDADGTGTASTAASASKTVYVGQLAPGTGKVNVGSFNGKLVVYASGLNGARISWKVGGVWGVGTATSNYSIFNRPTPRAGVTVSVDVYVNGVKTLTKSVVTR